MNLQSVKEGRDIFAEEIQNMKEKASELKKKLEDIGPVNMVAMEEYNELKERFEFLTAQDKDLRDAKESFF